MNRYNRSFVSVVAGRPAAELEFNKLIDLLVDAPHSMRQGALERLVEMANLRKVYWVVRDAGKVLCERYGETG